MYEFSSPQRTNWKSFSVKHTVICYHIWDNLSNACLEPRMTSQHRRSAICAYCPNFSPIETFLYQKSVDLAENIYTTCMRFKWLTKQELIFEVRIVDITYIRISSVDSSNCKTKMGDCLICSTTWFLISSDIS